MLDEIEDDYAIFENDVEEIINFVNPIRTYTIRPRESHMEKWNDSEFYERFRLSKPTVSMILEKIEGILQHRSDRNLHRAIQPLDQLLTTLRFFATGNFYRTVGDISNIHRSTTGRIVSKVTEALCMLRPEYIKFPGTDRKKQSTMTTFYEIARFPRVLGAIDCTHVKIQSVGAETGEVFRNRKGIFSLNIQAVCDAENKILDIVARWPGSAHDSHIFNSSAIKMRFEVGEFDDGILLGDSGYPIKPYLMIPFHNPQTEAEFLYNESQIRTRNVIERTFGIMKRRFPILSIGMRCKLQLIQRIITACAVLHNIACDENEAHFEGACEDEEMEEIEANEDI